MTRCVYVPAVQSDVDMISVRMPVGQMYAVIFINNIWLSI